MYESHNLHVLFMVFMEYDGWRDMKESELGRAYDKIIYIIGLIYSVQLPNGISSIGNKSTLVEKKIFEHFSFGISLCRVCHVTLANTNFLISNATPYIPDHFQIPQNIVDRFNVQCPITIFNTEIFNVFRFSAKLDIKKKKKRKFATTPQS